MTHAELVAVETGAPVERPEPPHLGVVITEIRNEDIMPSEDARLPPSSVARYRSSRGRSSAKPAREPARVHLGDLREDRW